MLLDEGGEPPTLTRVTPTSAREVRPYAETHDSRDEFHVRLGLIEAPESGLWIPRDRIPALIAWLARVYAAR